MLHPSGLEFPTHSVTQSRTDRSYSRLHQNTGHITMLPQDVLPPRMQKRSLSDHELSESTDGEPRAPFPQNDSDGIDGGPSTSADRDRSMSISERPHKMKRVQRVPTPGSPKQCHDVYSSSSKAAVRDTCGPQREGSRKPDPDATCYQSADTSDSRRPLADFSNRQRHGSMSASTNRNDSLTHSIYGLLPITATIPHGSSHLVFSGSTDPILPPNVPQFSSSSAGSSAGPSRRGMAVLNNSQDPFLDGTGAGSCPPPSPPSLPPIDRPPRRAFVFPRDAGRNSFAPAPPYVPSMNKRLPKDYFPTQNVQNPQPVRSAAGTSLPVAPPGPCVSTMNGPTSQRSAFPQNVQNHPPVTTAAGTPSIGPPPYFPSMNKPSAFRPPKNAQYPLPIQGSAGTLHSRPSRNHPPVRAAAGTLPPAPPSYFLPIYRPRPQGQATPQDSGHPSTSSTEDGKVTSASDCEPYIPLLKIAEHLPPQASASQHDNTESLGRKRPRKQILRAAQEPEVSSSSTVSENAPETSRAIVAQRTRDSRAPESTKPTENPPHQRIEGYAALGREPQELATTLVSELPHVTAPPRLTGSAQTSTLPQGAPAERPQPIKPRRFRSTLSETFRLIIQSMCILNPWPKDLTASGPEYPCVDGGW